MFAFNDTYVYIHEISTQRGDEMRTNIDIDDSLMNAVISACGYKTKKETVEESLKMMLRINKQRSFRSLRGRINWEGDLESMRKD